MKKLLSQLCLSFAFSVAFMFSVFLVHELSHMYRLQTRTERSRVCVGERQSESDSVQIVPLIINDSWYHEFLFHISYMTRLCCCSCSLDSIFLAPAKLLVFHLFGSTLRISSNRTGLKDLFEFDNDTQALEFFIYLNSDFLSTLASVFIRRRRRWAAPH